MAQMSDSASTSPSDSTPSLDSAETSAVSDAATPPEPVESDPSTQSDPVTPAEPPPSYVKLAMRNMVKKGGKSLFHFTLTTVGLVGLLIGLAYLTR